ncbi:hypothetical protein [Priestia megaterium]|uniref:hypothetical protein n=1 Tax=Priestia megaterium TaxID=1404 RepID=UPI000BFE1DD2|nr:hypothetical protein [Priestia megaterium]PGT76803.1 hypothetical protein COD15_03010 [Priestia megaterium]
MPITERIVIDADPSIKKMLSEISEEYGETMKAVVCSLIESKYKELQLRKQGEISEYFLNSRLENLKN